MQVYEDSLKQGERPCVGRQCPRCAGSQRLQRHGSYRRYRGVDGAAVVDVQRYVCPRCGRTWGVIPAGMMPYRSLEVGRFEELVDEQFAMTGAGARPPPATENENGCVRRALETLSKRIPLLCAFLGQQMAVPGSIDIRGFWRAFREWGSTQSSLVAMARNFKTSLLGCYRSLRAFWEREVGPAASG